jgi:hypothetical protein
MLIRKQCNITPPSVSGCCQRAGEDCANRRPGVAAAAADIFSCFQCCSCGPSWYCHGAVRCSCCVGCWRAVWHTLICCCWCHTGGEGTRTEHGNISMEAWHADVQGAAADCNSSGCCSVCCRVSCLVCICTHLKPASRTACLPGLQNCQISSDAAIRSDAVFCLPNNMSAMCCQPCAASASCLQLAWHGIPD